MSDIRKSFDAKWIAEPNSGCWLWTASLFRNGYGQINPEGTGVSQRRAHRLSWELHKGPIPHGAQVLHKCDVRSCVNPDHLFLGTGADNMADMIAKGRAKHPARLSADQVRHIRSAEVPQKDLSAQYGISQSYVSQIRSGKYRASA